MAERKTKGRFTIQFNMADPQQASAAELLEQQERHKAQFLTNAIRSYIEIQRGDGRVPELVDLEKRVRELVEQYIASPESPLDAKKPKTEATNRERNAGNKVDYSAVTETLLAFDAPMG